MRKEIMIFAAGFGTRMAPITNTIPKPMVPVGDTTLIDHTLGLVKSAGFHTIVVNGHYRSDQLAEHLKSENIIFCHEPDILDTGGGLKAALGHFQGDMIVTTNSDAVWSGPNPFTVLPNDLNDCDAILLCAHKDHTLGRDGTGDFTVDHAMNIQRGGDFVYLGIQLIRRELVEQHDEQVFSLNTIWNKLIAKNRIKAAIYNGTWCDVGRPDNIAIAERMLSDV